MAYSFTGEILGYEHLYNGFISSPDLEALARGEAAQEQKGETQERLNRGCNDEGQGQEVRGWCFSKKPGK